jgi:uncharacterized protein YegL
LTLSLSKEVRLKEVIIMKKGLTELVFIIDRSGSMAGLESDTIGGFDSMLKEHQTVEGEAFVTTVLFDDKYELLHDRVDIQAVAPMTDKEYTVRGSTALYEALGKTMNKIRAAHEDTDEALSPEKVMFIVITDGCENASMKYTAEQLKARIEHQREKHGWEAVSSGANMDAAMEAGKIGIPKDSSLNYRADVAGTDEAYSAMSAISKSYRSGEPFSNPANSDSIDSDMKSGVSYLWSW